jgi:tetratricopeptide (TPR) repeat protein
MYTRRAVAGAAQCEHALALDRNLASAHAGVGHGKIATGRAKEAEAHIVEALRLSPRDTSACYWMSWVGNANCNLGRWEQAVAWYRRSIEANRNFPHSHFMLGMALARLGRFEEARASVETGLALNPSFTIARARATWTAMSNDPTYPARLEPMLEGFRQAGVPEQ